MPWAIRKYENRRMPSPAKVPDIDEVMQDEQGRQQRSRAVQGLAGGFGGTMNVQAANPDPLGNALKTRGMEHRAEFEREENLHNPFLSGPLRDPSAEGFKQALFEQGVERVGSYRGPEGPLAYRPGGSPTINGRVNTSYQSTADPYQTSLTGGAVDALRKSVMKPRSRGRY